MISARISKRAFTAKRLQSQLDNAARSYINHPRGASVDGQGHWVGPTVIDGAQPDWPAGCEEIFGPVLTIIRCRDLDEALAIENANPYGNAAAIYTTSGGVAQLFVERAGAGMIGVNVGVPAPMAWFPFTGWNQSFFGDLHIQGTESVHFYTKQKMTLTRLDWIHSHPGATRRELNGKYFR